MSDTLKRLGGPTAVGSGTSTVLTVPGNHTYTVRNISIVNVNVSPVTVKLGINGVADGDLILQPTSILSNGLGEFTGMLVLQSTDTLQINASSTGITVSVHGLDQV